MDPDGPRVATTTVDGVTTLWADLDGDALGALVVGGGARHLAPTDAGLHHLVEHVVMHRVGRVSAEHNAVSGPDDVLFWAQGSRADVTDFVQRVAAVLGGLDDVTPQEVDQQRATILREVGVEALSVSPGPFAARWGAAGLGTVDLDHAALAALGPEDVRRHARAWFVRDDARLVLSFPPPDDLTLPLPPGARPLLSPETPWDGPLPGLFISPQDSVTLSFVVDAPRALASLCAAVVEHALLDDLRAARGLVYQVDRSVWGLGGGRYLVVLATDPSSAQAARVLLDACRALRAIGTEGPQGDVLEHARAAFLAELGSQRGRRSMLLAAAGADLAGREPVDPPAVFAAIRAASADEVRETLRRAWPTTIATLPGGGDRPDAVETALLDEVGLHPRGFVPLLLDDRRSVLRQLRHGSRRAVVRRRRGSLPFRGEEVWLGEREIAVPAAGGRLHVDDVVLVGEDDDGRVQLVGRGGGSLVVEPGRLRRAKVPWDRFLAHVPPSAARHRRTSSTSTDEARP
ncbi:insulinase family protein [Cellulomonas massiliensis]|uniref:insulinase family protein n=1 Tax=Cellulomonas massiliensis TaxID=1465811 RepID=UPI0002F1D9C7|nr:insulinase family protein [Cellulomonas massiliensis]